MDRINVFAFTTASRCAMERADALLTLLDDCKEECSVFESEGGIMFSWNRRHSVHCDIDSTTDTIDIYRSGPPTADHFVDIRMWEASDPASAATIIKKLLNVNTSAN